MQFKKKFFEFYSYSDSVCIYCNSEIPYFYSIFPMDFFVRLLSKFTSYSNTQ